MLFKEGLASNIIIAGRQQLDKSGRQHINDVDEQAVPAALRYIADRHDEAGSAGERRGADRSCSAPPEPTRVLSPAWSASSSMTSTGISCKIELLKDTIEIAQVRGALEDRDEHSFPAVVRQHSHRASRRARRRCFGGQPAWDFGTIAICGFPEGEGLAQAGCVDWSMKRVADPGNHDDHRIAVVTCKSRNSSKGERLSALDVAQNEAGGRFSRRRPGGNALAEDIWSPQRRSRSLLSPPR